MPSITHGHVRVFTYKDDSRLLSPIAHDLQLSCARFRVNLDGDRVTATFEPESIEVDGPMKQGALDRGGFGRIERGKIKSAIRKDVLRTKKHPIIRLDGSLSSDTLSGRLTLAGQTREISLPVTFADGRATGRLELRPSRWGIKPYKALMGALRLQDRVTVTFDLPVER